MEPQTERPAEVDDLEALVESGDATSMRRFLSLLHPADLAILFDTLDRDHWPRVVAALETAQVSDLMEELPDHLRDDLAELLKPQQLLDIVEEMASDDAADVLADLPEELAEKVLAGMETKDRVDVETLLRYPEDSAGGLMQMELVKVDEQATADQAVEVIRANREEVGDFHVVYVVDRQGRLTGQLPLDRLILASADTAIAELSDRDIFTVRPHMDQEEVAQMFKRYDLVSLAVTDDHGKLLGRILHDDIVDVLEEEADEDFLRMAGAEEPELVYTNRVFKIASVRLPWLMATLGGGLITGTIVDRFKLSFPDLLTLLTFFPVIAAMGGNVGSQSSTIVVRGFATGRIDFNNLRKYLFREMTIGIIIGSCCGLVLGIAADLWHGNPLLGITVGVSMVAAITTSSITGVLIPFFFKMIKIDPAIAAGPLVTTGNDIVGLSIYYLLALSMLT